MMLDYKGKGLINIALQKASCFALISTDDIGQENEYPVVIFVLMREGMIFKVSFLFLTLASCF